MPEPPQAPGSEDTNTAGPGEEAASFSGLLLAVLASLSSLIAGKLRLAEREFSRDLSVLLGGVALLTVFLALLLLGLGFAGAGTALLLGKVTGSQGGALLLVAAAYLLGGLVALAAAWTRLKRLRGFLRESRADLRRDVEWLKNLP